MSDNKIDKIHDDVVDIKISIVEIQKDIAYHIRRTDLAEERIEMLQGQVNPISKHVERVNFIIKLIIAVVGFIGLLASIAQIKSVIG